MKGKILSTAVAVFRDERVNALLETDLNSLKTSIQIGDKKEKEKRSQELPGLTLLT